VRDLIAIALGLKTEPVPLNHMAGTFHIETEEGTYTGRFLAPITSKELSAVKVRRLIIRYVFM
jgi:hypothetical protein